MRDEISVQLGDLTNHGTFKADKGLVTVRTAYGLKSTTLGGKPADTIARKLLRELVLEDQVRRNVVL